MTDVTAWPRTNLKDIPRRDTYKYTKRFTKEKLDSLRLEGDPLADNVVAELHANHGGLTKIHDLLTTVRDKAANVEGPAGDVFRDFLHVIKKKPAWADPEMIERGQRVFATHLPFMGLSLFSGSLIGGAQFITAGAVTTLAGNITTNPTRRMDETGMLLLAMIFPGALYEAGSEAHDSLNRVRLLHAALRHWLPRSGRLDKLKRIVPGNIWVEGEVPVNQQDLAITLAVFCYINLRSCRRMGVVLSSHDINAYVQMWRYAGFVLGIKEELLPERLEDQEEFMLCSMLHQGVPEIIPGKPVKEFIYAFSARANRRTFGMVPAGTVQTFLEQMTRFMNGEDVVQTMEIEDFGESHWSVRLIRALGWSFGTFLPRNVPFMESALYHLHTSRVRAELRRRGTPIGHGAGTGPDLAMTPRSKL
jgi:hypothetical protein